MSESRPNLDTAFTLAAQVETESPQEHVDDVDLARLGLDPNLIPDALADVDSWPVDQLPTEIDALLTIDPMNSSNARLSASARTAMVEGASRAMERWQSAASQPDAVELLMRELAAVPDLDDPTIAVGRATAASTAPRLHRRARADELADEIDAILSSARDPSGYDARIFDDLIRDAEIDMQIALDGIRAATQQDSEYRQVVYQGSAAAATCSVAWSQFLAKLAELLGLAD